MINDNPFVNSIIIQYPEGDSSRERTSYYLNRSNSITHTVREGETIQSIAFRYYGDSGSWYKIADLNNISFPFRDLEEGLELIIPQ